MRRKYIAISLAGIVGLCLLASLVYQIPFIHDRLGWRVDSGIVQIRRFFNPPEEVIFVPQEQVDAIVNATLTAMAATGVVSLPGMMTGQILAGVEPVQAAKYQVMIMFLIAGATCMAVVAAGIGAVLLMTDERHRLRLDRLEA